MARSTRVLVTVVTVLALTLGMIAQALTAFATHDPDFTLNNVDWSGIYFTENVEFTDAAEGEEFQFFVQFTNLGQRSWVLGQAGAEARLAAIDPVTRVDSTADIAAGWVVDPLSPNRITRQEDAIVLPGHEGSFIWTGVVPEGAELGQKRINGRPVIDGQMFLEDYGYYQGFNVVAEPVEVQRVQVTPATDTNQTNTAHLVTVTVRNADGTPAVNVPVDWFIVNDASPFTMAGACSLDATASPSSSGTTACTIDIGDPLTDTNGQIQFSFGNTTAKTNRIVAWTGAQGATFNTNTTELQGSATKTWIAAVASLGATPQLKLNPFASAHSIVATLRDAQGNAVPLAGEVIRFEIRRGGLGDNAAVSGTNGCAAVATVISVGSVTTDAAGSATVSYTGPADPSTTTGDEVDDCIFLWHDANSNNIREAGEFTNTVSKGWRDTASVPSALVLTPGLDGNTESTTHTVTATLTNQFGDPMSGVTLRFTVTRIGMTSTTEENLGTVQSGVRTTGTNGQATFAYIGPAFSSRDTITVCTDLNNDGDCADASEIDQTSPSTGALKFWATAAVSGAYADQRTVRFCDTANNTVYADLNNVLFRFIYDSNDQFFIEGAPATMAAFATACTPKTHAQIAANTDLITIDTYSTDPGVVSTFDLEDNN